MRVLRKPWLWMLAALIVAMALGLVLASIGPHDIARINQANPALQAAAHEAQQRLPEFLHELQNPKPDERFAVKARFATPAGPEYLWIKDPTYDGSRFTGVLDQEPIAARTHRKGDTVTVSRNDVFDWLIRENGQNRGGFTEQALAGPSR